jgi:DNA modification methylase
MGSGTTGVACVNTHRNFIGFEINEKYFDLAKKRIAEAEAQQELGESPK